MCWLILLLQYYRFNNSKLLTKGKKSDSCHLLFKLEDESLCSHVCLVIVAYLLDPDVVFGVYVGFGGGVGLGKCYHAGYILKIIMVVYLHLL